MHWNHWSSQLSDWAELSPLVVFTNLDWGWSKLEHHPSIHPKTYMNIIWYDMNQKTKITSLSIVSSLHHLWMTRHCSTPWWSAAGAQQITIVPSDVTEKSVVHGVWPAKVGSMSLLKLTGCLTILKWVQYILLYNTILNNPHIWPPVSE